MTGSDMLPEVACRRLLAIDYGSRRIGTAIFRRDEDPGPLPRWTLQNRGAGELIREICAIVSEEGLTGVVLGVPRLLDGGETSMTRIVLQFARKLATALNPVPVGMQDETLSTYEARERMKNSPRYNFKVDPRQIDAVAAVIILEDFLSRRNLPGTP